MKKPTQATRHNRGNGQGKEITPMLTIGKACQILYVHCNTLRRWTERGLITAYRIGPRGDRRYRREDVDALLAEQTSFGSNGARK
ncbi:MAG TPA: helix-turn-helix domain-containing protein [Dehalococcoidia bacterium]|nr:helix-turn-helix domain-containing protein [Dehalococcoidia bacterium]